jgi:Ca2+-binding RTX toxin-like protein
MAWRRHRYRGAWPVLAIALVVIPAQSDASTASREGGTVTVEAAADERNLVTSTIGDDGRYQVKDEANIHYINPTPPPQSGISTGPGCERNTGNLIGAYCGPGADVTLLQILLGDLDDRAGPPAGQAGARYEGGDGDDELLGGALPDQLDGGAGDDTLAGYDANDALLGLAGADRIVGGDGDDTLAGGDDRDNMDGGDGNDALRGGAGNDKLNGRVGNDKIGGDAGRDIFSGGTGNDTIRARDGSADRINCGAGRDKAVIDRTDRVVGCETVRKR